MSRIHISGRTSLAALFAFALGLSLLWPAEGLAVEELNPPDTIIDSGPIGPTNNPAPTFTYHSTQPGSTFECSIDTGTPGFGPCPTTPQKLADGAYVFRVRAVSAEGTDPTPATRDFIVDTVPPDTIIDSGPSGPTEDPNPTFTYHSTEAGSTFECSLDTGTPAFEACDALPAELENGFYVFRVRATDPAGNTDPTPAIREFTLFTLPEPEYGKTVNLEHVSGKVLVREKGHKKFHVLHSPIQVQLGSVIDATQGRADLTTAKSKGGPPQSAEFFDGLFEISQATSGPPITVLNLVSTSSCAKGSKQQATAAGSKSNGLWGSGHGNYRSVGKHGSATVRGTIWFTEDRCDGTFFRVRRGVVVIRDFTRHRTVTLHKGDTYLAPNP